MDSENDCARFRGHSRFEVKAYFFFEAFFLAFFLAFAMASLQFQVSPGCEYIHALSNYNKSFIIECSVIDVSCHSRDRMKRQ